MLVEPSLYLHCTCYGPSSVLIISLSVLFVHLTMNAFSEGVTSVAYWSFCHRTNQWIGSQ